MGIFCQINLLKSSDGAFYSGELVSGMIKYALDEPMDIDKVTISLKGMGYLRIQERRNSKRKQNYYNSEVYVDIDEIVQEGKLKVPVGSYEQKFSFKLPGNIPPSFHFLKNLRGHRVDCHIKYYVRIKFDRPGWFVFAKHFRKEITVASTVTPRLSMEPIMYGGRSTLMTLFSSKTSMVFMKENIINSVIPNGGKIEIQSEVKNDTNIIIKSVQAQLIEVLEFKLGESRKVRSDEEVPNCECKTSSIKCGDIQTMPLEINVPSDIVSLENSTLVSRSYVVKITAALPIPHRNVVVEIPVQIGDKVRRQEICESPPTYWEAMNEVKKEDDAGDNAGDDTDDGTVENEKGEKS